MKTLRILGLSLLALTLALGLSACAKQSESEVSMPPVEENPATVSEPVPADQAPTTDQVASNPEPAPAPVKKASTKPKSTTPKSTVVPASETRTVSVPTGTSFDIELITPIHTKTSNVGDKIEGKLMHPLNAPDGSVIAVTGALIRGEIVDLTRASKSRAEEDRASVKLAFTSIETVDGEKSLQTTVTNVESLQAGSTTKRDALIIGGSAVAGAVLGKVIGKDTKDAAIGAVAGAVVGTGAVMASKGHELEIAAGSKISVRADQPITVVQR
jgi:hypothetical protein